MAKPGNSKKQANGNGTSARFQVGEKVICYHAKGNYIAQVLMEVGRHAYLVHYWGWNKKLDEIVNEDQLDKLGSNVRSFHWKKKRVPQQLGRKQQSRKPVTLSTPSPPAAAAEKQSRGGCPESLRRRLLRKHLPHKGSQRTVKHQKSAAASSSHHFIPQRQKKTSSIPVKPISDETVAIARRVPYSYLISLTKPIKISVDVDNEKLACPVIVTSKLPHLLKRILVGDHCRIIENQCLRIPGRYTVDVCLNDYVLSLAGQNEKIVQNVGDFVEKLRTKFNASCEFVYAGEKTQYAQVKGNVINCSFVYPAVALLRLLNTFETFTVDCRIEQLVALEMRAQLLKFFEYLMERSTTIFDTVYDARAGPSGTS